MARDMFTDTHSTIFFLKDFSNCHQRYLVLLFLVSLFGKVQINQTQYAHNITKTTAGLQNVRYLFYSQRVKECHVVI